MSATDLFEDVIDFPDPTASAAYDRLVGLDAIKERLTKETLLLLDPNLLREWSRAHHRAELAALDYVASRPPLFVLAGDVGTGKTALARGFGNEVAKQARVSVQLFVLSLNARGRGAVGEMTRLISQAFTEVREQVTRSRGKDGRSNRGVILLIDEADALAQSREMAQMHHEDRAGVNALIRGVDETATGRLPVAVVMCTNRLDAIDPAVRRRAAAVFEFRRPSADQRRAVLELALQQAGLTDDELVALVEATGPTDDRAFGYTYSDLTDRLVPALVLDAFPDRPLTGSRALQLVREVSATPPFQEQAQPVAAQGAKPTP